MWPPRGRRTAARPRGRAPDAPVDLAIGATGLLQWAATAEAGTDRTRSRGASARRASVPTTSPGISRSVDDLAQQRVPQLDAIVPSLPEQVLVPQVVRGTGAACRARARSPDGAGRGAAGTPRRPAPTTTGQEPGRQSVEAGSSRSREQGGQVLPGLAEGQQLLGEEGLTAGSGRRAGPPPRAGARRRAAPPGATSRPGSTAPAPG